MRKLFTLISIAIGYLAKTTLVGIVLILILPDPTPQRILGTITLIGIISLIYKAYKNRNNG